MPPQREGVVREYRIFKIGKDGRISSPPEIVTAETDDEAISKAKAMKGALDAEIWEGTRLVCRLPPLRG
jgi:hypothetical protein